MKKKKRVGSSSRSTDKSDSKPKKTVKKSQPDEDPAIALQRATAAMANKKDTSLDHLDVPPPPPKEEEPEPSEKTGGRQAPTPPQQALLDDSKEHSSSSEDKPQDAPNSFIDEITAEVPAPSQDTKENKKEQSAQENTAKKQPSKEEQDSSEASKTEDTDFLKDDEALSSLKKVHKNKINHLEKKKSEKVEEILKLDNWIEEKILKNWSDKKIADELVKQGFAKDLIELCQRRVLRKLQGAEPEEKNLKQNIGTLVSQVRSTFTKEQDLGKEIVDAKGEKATAENIAKLDNWIEDKIQKGWDDHTIYTELLKQGWAHDIIRESQLRINRKISGKPKFGEKPTEEETKSPLNNFIKTIRQTFKKEESMSEKLIDDINREEELREQEIVRQQEKDEEAQKEREKLSQKDKKQDSEILGVKTKLERLDAQISALGEFRKVVNERFMRVAEETGNLRGNIVNVEKDVTEITARVSKAVDLVEAVQPQALFTEIKKTDAKLEAQRARIEGTKEISDKIMKELKDVRSKLGVIRGVEEIMKIHDEIKDTFAQVEQMKVLSERHADKVENLFMETKKRLASMDTFEQTAKNLQGTSTEVLKEMQKLKTRELQYVTKDQLDTAKKEMEEAAEVTTTTVNELKTQVAQEQSGDELSHLRSDTEEAQEVLQQSITQVKEEIAQLHQQSSAQNKKQLDNIMYRLEQLEQKMHESPQSKQDTPVEQLAHALQQLQQPTQPQPVIVNSSPAPVAPAPSPVTAPLTPSPARTPSPTPRTPSTSATGPIDRYNRELQRENHQFMNYMMDLTKREFSLIKSEMEQLRRDHGRPARPNPREIPEIQAYLARLGPRFTKHQIVASFCSLGWPRPVVEHQIHLYEKKTRKHFH